MVAQGVYQCRCGCRYLSGPRQADYVKGGWNYTGDAYLQDVDGYFFYQSRTDDMIISAGYNIAAVEVEDVLLRHEAVAECAVIGVPSDEAGEIPKAFVVLRGSATAEEIIAYVASRVAPHAKIRAVEFVDAIPKSPSGKILRRELRRRINT